MGYLGDLAQNFVQIERVVNQPMDTEKLEDYMRQKTIESTDGDDARCINKTVWQEEDDEEWCGSAPKIQVCYDDTNGFFLWVRLDVDKKKVELPEEAERAGLDVDKKKVELPEEAERAGL